MSPIEIGIASVVLIVLLIYAGLYIPIALGLVSFLGVWIIRDNVDIAVALLSESIADTVAEQVFATVPLFALMGLIVSKAGLGKDVYQVAHSRRPRHRHRRRQCDLCLDHRVFHCVRVCFYPRRRSRDEALRV
jgi:TRAP-type mannitol/chloroaromatic compound transport system permease large subunit